MDAGEKLQSILSSPDGMEKLQEAAKQLQGVLGDSGDLSGLLQSFAGSLPAAPARHTDGCSGEAGHPDGCRKI